MLPATGDFADETSVKVAGRWTYLYRAIDQHGQVIDVLVSARRDLAAARRFFTRALRSGTIPAEVTTDRAPAYPRVLDELIPSALHTTGQCANNPVEADHGRLKARLRPMRGLKRRRSARILAAGRAFVQNLRRGHYEIATDIPPATGHAQPSTSSPQPSDRPVILISALCHAHRSANATLPPGGHRAFRCQRSHGQVPDQRRRRRRSGTTGSAGRRPVSPSSSGHVVAVLGGPAR